MARNIVKTYHTMQGKPIDMDKLRQKNELVPAVGNVKVNARGDELGPGGKIIRTREQILKEYYETADSIPNETPIKRTTTPVVPEEVVQPKIRTTEKEEWVEDEDGNFVEKKTTRSKSK